jgi:hypothetical protein
MTWNICSTSSVTETYPVVLQTGYECDPIQDVME